MIFLHFVGGPLDGKIQEDKGPPDQISTTWLRRQGEDLYALYTIDFERKWDDDIERRYQYAGTYTWEEGTKLFNEHRKRFAGDAEEGDVPS